MSSRNVAGKHRTSGLRASLKNVLPVVAVAVLGALSGCSSDAASDQAQGAQTRSATAGAYELYFTNPIPAMMEKGRVKDSTKNDKGHTWSDLAKVDVAGGRNLSDRLVQLVDGASGAGCSVLVADYDLNLDKVGDALVRAKKRGCDVRLVTDGDTVAKSEHRADTNGRISKDPAYQRVFTALRGAGIEIHHDGTRKGIMHDKFAVVGSDVWAGSWNFSDDDEASFWNNGAVFHNADAAKHYTEAFEAMWKRFDADGNVGGQAFTPAARKFTIGKGEFEVHFPSGDKATSRIVEVLKSAQKSIHLLAFQFSSQEMGDAVVERAKAGVEVRGVWENSGACRGVFKDLETLSGGKNTDKLSIFRWQYGPRDFMHEKVFVVDGRWVIFSSFNFTKSADNANDENLVVVDDAEMAAVFEQRHALVEEAVQLSPAPPSCASHAQNDEDGETDPYADPEGAEDTYATEESD